MTHRPVALLALFIALAIGPAPAQAEDEVEWSLYGSTTSDDVLHRAMICPDSDEATGNLFCLALGCQVDEPLAWRLHFAGRIIVPNAQTMQFRIDDTDYAVIDLTRLPGPEMQYTARYDPDRDAGLVAAMRRATRGVVVIRALANHHRTFYLAGADAALDTVLTQCPLPE